MRCREIMTMDLRWIPATASVRDAAICMRDNSIGFLPICNDKGRLVGVVTDRDLAVRACAENLAADETPISEVMTAPGIACWEEAEIAHAENLMTEHQVRRLPIIGPSDAVVGVISLEDVVGKLGRAEALKTARAVMARDEGGPHVPLSSIHLTPSPPPSKADQDERLFNDESRSREEARSVAIGRWPGVR